MPTVTTIPQVIAIRTVIMRTLPVLAAQSLRLRSLATVIMRAKMDRVTKRIASLFPLYDQVNV